MTVSGVDSVRMRVHIYERGFRRKPVKRVPADEVHGGVTHDTGGTLGDVTDEARFCRTTATCIWSVSDPLFRATNLDRRVAEGVAHAPDLSGTVADSRADCDKGGTERRPTDAAKSLTRREIDKSICIDHVHARARFDGGAGRPEGGTLLPSLCSPRFRNRRPTDRNQEGRNEDQPRKWEAATRNPANP